jgi:hypothetical protein
MDKVDKLRNRFAIRPVSPAILPVNPTDAYDKSRVSDKVIGQEPRRHGVDHVFDDIQPTAPIADPAAAGMVIHSRILYSQGKAAAWKGWHGSVIAMDDGTYIARRKWGPIRYKDDCTMPSQLTHVKNNVHTSKWAAFNDIDGAAELKRREGYTEHPSSLKL